MTVSLEWTPQRTVRAAIVVSAVATAFCLAVVAFAFARRRRRYAVDAALSSRALLMDSHPTLRERLLPEPLASRPVATGVVVGLTGAAAAFLVAPWVGVVVAGLTWLAIRRPRWRVVVRFGPAAILGVVALYMTGAQILRHYPPRFDWPTFFEPARILTWIAVLLLAVDVVIGMVWRTGSEGDSADA